MKEKATIYDYVRMCRIVCRMFDECSGCPLIDSAGNCLNFVPQDIELDKVNEIILKWCKEHPIKTRQSEFLKMFPNAHIYTDGVLEAKPCHIDETVECSSEDDCDLCRSKYWLAEVNTNES